MFAPCSSRIFIDPTQLSFIHSTATDRYTAGYEPHADRFFPMPVNTAMGMLVVWTDVIAEHETEFNAWYTDQHLPERVAIPGFLNVRRYGATQSPKYLAYYETESVEVMASTAYTERLANPTDWTRRVMPWFVATTRSACRVTAEFGHGVGGAAQTITFSMPQAGEARGPRPASPDEVALGHFLVAKALPEAASHLGCVRAWLLHNDPSITDRPSPERALRPHRDSAADWVIAIEAVVESAQPEIIGPIETALRENGATDIRNQGPYQLLSYLRKE